VARAGARPRHPGRRAGSDSGAACPAADRVRRSRCARSRSPLLRAAGQRRRRGELLGKPGRGRGQAVEHPMHPGAQRRIRIVAEQAKPVVPAGAPRHSSAGETSSPSQVKRTGMASPSSKAGLASSMVVLLRSWTARPPGDSPGRLLDAQPEARRFTSRLPSRPQPSSRKTSPTRRPAPGPVSRRAPS